MSTLDDALHTILSADYGLNEGDHLLLCDILKKAHSETKKCTKKISSIDTKTLNISIIPMKGDGAPTYFLDTMTTTYYKKNGDDHVMPTYAVEGSIHESSAVASIPKVWKHSASQVIQAILEIYQEEGQFQITVDGIRNTVEYTDFIDSVMNTDKMEKIARRTYGALEDDKEECDESFWRGDYTYHRFVINIVRRLTI